jgi:hypothetical protein
VAAGCAAVLAAAAATAESGGPQRADLAGVYQAIADDVTLAGGLRNSGAPREVPLRPESLEQLKTVDLSLEPASLCQPVGPFRMMARAGMKFEIVPASKLGQIVMLFEDVSRGYIRTVGLNRDHPQGLEPTWQGDSVGRWEGDTLVIDTIGFNDRTWLNEIGAQHSEALRLVERVRPVLGGSYLQYQVTADDPAVLVKPYTYVRYFEKLRTEIAEDVCEE